MYRSYWQLIKKSFENTPDPDFFFPSHEHEEALERLQYVVNANKGAALLTGDYGTGKTTIIRKVAFEAQLNNISVAYLNNPRWEPEELLQEVLYQLGETEIPNSALELGRKIGDVLYDNMQEGLTTLIIIDEAQIIKSDNVFEELRLLLNYQLNDSFMVTLILSGQPELRERIMAIPQFEQRMFIKYHFHMLDLDNTHEYIKHRLRIAGTEQEIFSRDAVELIYQHSFGTPRRINNICDLALLTGFKKNVNIIDLNLVKNIV